MKNSNNVIKPKALKKGDVIGVVATGSPLDESRLNKGIKHIEQRGYKVKMPLSVSKFYGSDSMWANGSVKQRLNAFKDLLLDKEVKAIISARGGYGSLELLPFLDKKDFINNPKPIVGLSDFCSLLCYQSFIAKITSIHAASVGTSLADCEDIKKKDSALKDSDDLFEMLSNLNYLPEYKCEVLRPGKLGEESEGRILATNLTVLCSILGTNFDFDFTDLILVLEDVGEAPYKVHRMLTQLEQTGKFEKIKGLVFGRFAKCESKNGPGIEDVLSMFIEQNKHNFPVLKALEFGHWGRNVPLALNCKAKISSEDLIILESAVC